MKKKKSFLALTSMVFVLGLTSCNQTSTNISSSQISQSTVDTTSSSTTNESTSSATNTTTSSSSSSSSSGVEKAVTSVVVTADKLTIAKGETIQLTATVNGDALEETDKGVSFSIVSGDDQVAVSEAGVVSLLGTATNGSKAKIKATSRFDDTKFGEIEITVVFAKAITSFTATCDKETLTSYNETAQISVTIEGDVLEEDDKKVMYSLAEGEGVSISAAGLVTCLDTATNGNVSILVVSTFDSTKRATINLAINIQKAVTEVSCEKSSDTIKFSEPVTLTPNVSGTNLKDEDKGVTYTVTDETPLVSVSKKGVVSMLDTTKASGTATIRVSSVLDSTKYIDVQLTVYVPAITSFYVYSDETSVDAIDGGTINLLDRYGFSPNSGLAESDKKLSMEVIEGAEYVQDGKPTDDGHLVIKPNSEAGKSIKVKIWPTYAPSWAKEISISLLGRIKVSLMLPEGMIAKYYYTDEASSSSVKGEEITDLNNVKAKSFIYVELADDPSDEKILKFNPTSSFSGSGSYYYKSSGNVTYKYYTALGNVLLIDAEGAKSDFSFDLSSCVDDYTSIVGTFKGTDLTSGEAATMTFTEDGKLVYNETNNFTFTKSTSSYYDYSITANSGSSWVSVKDDVIYACVTVSNYSYHYFVLSKDTSFSVGNYVAENASRAETFVGYYSLNGVDTLFYLDEYNLYNADLTITYEKTSFADSSYAYLAGSFNSKGEVKLILTTNSDSKVVFKIQTQDGLKGTYTCDGGSNLVLDGYSYYSSNASYLTYGLFTLGEKTGKYVPTGYSSNTLNITFDDGTTTAFELDTTYMTYVEKDVISGEIFSQATTYSNGTLTLAFDGNGTVTVTDSTATHKETSSSPSYSINGKTASYTTANNVLSFKLTSISWAYGYYDGDASATFEFEVSSKDPESLTVKSSVSFQYEDEYSYSSQTLVSSYDSTAKTFNKVTE